MCRADLPCHKPVRATQPRRCVHCFLAFDIAPSSRPFSLCFADTLKTLARMFCAFAPIWSRVGEFQQKRYNFRTLHCFQRYIHHPLPHHPPYRRTAQRSSGTRWRLDLATVHAAMAFHYDNEAASNEAIRQARKLGEQLGARSMQAALEEMRGRKKAT